MSLDLPRHTLHPRLVNAGLEVQTQLHCRANRTDGDEALHMCESCEPFSRQASIQQLALMAACQHAYGDYSLPPADTPPGQAGLLPFFSKFL